MGDNKKGCPKKTAFFSYKFFRPRVFLENKLFGLVNILCSLN